MIIPRAPIIQDAGKGKKVKAIKEGIVSLTYFEGLQKQAIHSGMISDAAPRRKSPPNLLPSGMKTAATPKHVGTIQNPGSRKTL